MGTSVLIVEDNPLNMQLAADLLEVAGFTVLQAGTAEDGIFMTQTQRPALVLMDIALPGMDGLEATRLLKADPVTRAIPIVALTASAMKGDEEKILANGCDGYINKPIDTRQFVSLVRGFLHQPALPAVTLVPAPAAVHVGRSRQESTGLLAAATQPAHPEARVLVVDDDARNRTLLKDFLEAYGYLVAEAVDGEEALQRLAQEPPDVVLLDVMMPGLDGFEVCRRIKADPATAATPVLLVTALANRSERLAGIEAGANDFITKPVDVQDVLLRVRNAAYSKHLYDEVQRNYRKLQQVETLRDQLTHMMAHDMRSPLLGVIGYLDLLQTDADRLSSKEQRFIDQAAASAGTLVAMIDAMLDVNRLEEGQMPLDLRPVALDALVREAVASLGGLARQARIETIFPPEPWQVVCDSGLILRVLANLLANGIRFNKAGEPLVARLEQDGTQVRFSLADNGPGISPEHRERIFEKFGQIGGRGPRHSSGLGLAFCKLAIEAHGGRIGVECAAGGGSIFWFTLPLATAENQ